MFEIRAESGETFYAFVLSAEEQVADFSPSSRMVFESRAFAVAMANVCAEGIGGAFEVVDADTGEVTAKCTKSD